MDAADVIIEVLDARDPLATRCTDVERYVRKRGAAKKLILLLNKIGGPPDACIFVFGPYHILCMPEQGCRMCLACRYACTRVRTVAW